MAGPQPEAAVDGTPAEPPQSSRVGHGRLLSNSRNQTFAVLLHRQDCAHPRHSSLRSRSPTSVIQAKPMTHLAKEFAISDVALEKVCGPRWRPRLPFCSVELRRAE
jgi:hypothetical protein